MLGEIKAAQPVLTREEVLKQIQAAKLEILELQQQKETQLRTRKLWFWKPSPKQSKFFGQSGKKRRAGFCGNRFGKSTLGVVEDCCWLIGYRPFFPEGHPLRTLGIPKHGVKGLVVAEDWDKVKEIFTNDDSIERQGKFWEFLPEDFVVKKHRNEKGIVDQITVRSIIDGAPRESIVYFDTVKSYKQAPMSFESGDWDFVHIDEPVMKPLWVAVSRGLIDRGGCAWWLLTPISEPWMYNEMVVDAKDDPETYWWFEASMDDNPMLSAQDKEIYLRQLPPDEREARQKGIPLAHGRLVYGHFSDDYHHFKGQRNDWVRVNKPDYGKSCVYYAVDTHPQTPHAVLFANVDEDGTIDLYDEIFEKCTISTLSETILAKLAGVRLAGSVCEPGAWNEDQGTGTSYATIFADYGLDLQPGSKEKETDTLLTQEMFKQRKVTLRIHTRCKNLRRELITNHFDKENKPADKDDHLLECLRRLVRLGLKWYPATYTDKPLQFTTEKMLEVGRHHLDLTMGQGELNLTKI